MPKAKSRTNPASKKDDAMTCVRSYARQEFRAVAGGEGNGDGEDDGIRSITGHPAVFNSPADIGGWFEETIDPGAFDDCDLTDVCLFANHRDMKIPLARSRRNNGSSTMQLSIDDIGLFEINEAFAAQCLACQKTLGIPDDKLNVNGSGISLGHPVGATGSRLVITCMYELMKRGQKYGLATLCAGGGMGTAVIIEMV